MEELGALYSIIILRNGTGQPGGAACAMCTMDKKKMSVSHVRNLLYQFKKRETNGDGSNKHTTAVAFCQICCISRVPFSLGASFLLARGGTQRVPANPPPAAGFDNPTGAIFAPKLIGTLRCYLRLKTEIAGAKGCAIARHDGDGMAARRQVKDTVTHPFLADTDAGITAFRNFTTALDYRR